MRESSLRYRPNIRVPIFVQTVMLRHTLKMARSDPLHRQHLPSFLRLGWLRPGVSGQLGGEGIAEAGVFPFFFLLEALLKIVFWIYQNLLRFSFDLLTFEHLCTIWESVGPEIQKRCFLVCRARSALPSAYWSLEPKTLHNLWTCTLEWEVRVGLRGGGGVGMGVSGIVFVGLVLGCIETKFCK